MPNPETAFIASLLHCTPKIVLHALNQVIAGDLTPQAATVGRAAYAVAVRQEAAGAGTEVIDREAIVNKLYSDGHMTDKNVQNLMQAAVASNRPPAAMWESHLRAIHEQRFRRDAKSLANAVSGFADGNINDLNESIRRFNKAIAPLMNRVPDDESTTSLKAA